MTEKNQEPALSTIANPQTAQEYIEQGWRYYAQHHYDGAADDFRIAIRLDEKLIDAHYGLAISERRLDHNDQALQSMRRAQELVKDENNPIDPNRRTILRLLIESQISIILGLNSSEA